MPRTTTSDGVAVEMWLVAFRLKLAREDVRWFYSVAIAGLGSQAQF